MISKHLDPAAETECEDKYRGEEFSFFKRQETNESDLKFKQIPFNKYGILNLYQVRKLKVTVVQNTLYAADT